MNTSEGKIGEVNGKQIREENHINAGEHGQISTDLKSLAEAEGAYNLHNVHVAQDYPDVQKDDTGVDELFRVVRVVVFYKGHVIHDYKSVGTVNSQHGNQRK